MCIWYHESKIKNKILQEWLCLAIEQIVILNSEKKYKLYITYTYTQNFSNLCLSGPAEVFKLNVFHFDTRAYHLCHEFTCIHHQNVKVTA